MYIVMTDKRAVHYQAAETIQISSFDISDISCGEALVKVTYAGICGTDMLIYAGKHPRAKAPLIMGHEFTGVIEQVSSSEGFSPGDRVVIEPTISCGECAACLKGQAHVCRNLKLLGVDYDGGFASYAKVPVRNLHKVPDALSDQLAVLAEPLAVAIHTVRRSKVQVGDSVAILGAGPIGLLVAIMLREAGALNIYVSDISSKRIQLAKSLGFSAVDAKKDNITDIVHADTKGAGVDVVFEIAGNQTTVNQSLDIAAIQAEIMIVSVFDESPTIDLSTMHFKELSINTTRCYSTFDFQKALHMLTNKSELFQQLISHVISLEEVEKGFRLMKNPEDSLKVIIQP